MIDKELFKLIGGNKKYIFTAVLTSLLIETGVVLISQDRVAASGLSLTVL